MMMGMHCYQIVFAGIAGLALSSFSSAREIANDALQLGQAKGPLIVAFSEGLKIPADLRKDDPAREAKRTDAGLALVPSDSAATRNLVYQGGVLVNDTGQLKDSDPFCVLSISPGASVSEFQPGQAMEMIVMAWSDRDAPEATVKKVVFRAISLDPVKKAKVFGIGPDRHNVEMNCWISAPRPVTVADFKSSFGTTARLFDPASTTLARQVDPTAWPDKIVDANHAPKPTPMPAPKISRKSLRHGR